MTVRGYFVLLVLAVAVPAAALSAILVWFNAETQRIEQERVLQDYAQALSEIVDREVGVAIATLETLRHAEPLRQGDLRSFEQVARRVHADNPHWLTIVLTRPDGQQLLNLAAPPGQALPNIGRSPVIQEVFRGRPAVSDLAVGQVTQAHLVSVHVPVLVDGTQRYALGMSLPARHFEQLAVNFPVPEDVIVQLVDRQGTIIARSADPERAVGTPTAELWMRSDAPKGVVRGTEQVPMVAAYARSELTGWRALVAMPVVTFNGQRDRQILLVALGAASLLGIGLVIAFSLGRRVVKPVEVLARHADEYVQGETLAPVRPGAPVEIGALERALREAGQMHREASRSHQESEQRFALLVQGVTDYAIYMLDPQGRVTSWNRGAQRIKGYSAEEITGSHVSRFYTEEDRRAGAPDRALATAAETGYFDSEGWRLRKDGSRFWAHVHIERLLDQDGRVAGFAKITRDVTEKREAETHLQQAREQLAQTRKMEAVGQLTGGVAHDFNNLLTIIIGNLDTSRRVLADWKEGAHARLTRAIENAMAGAQRAATLTSQLLAFSRRQPLEPKILDVNRLLLRQERFLKPTLGETIRLETVGAAGLWAIEVDENQLETSLLNLAINARDAMPRGGKLTIEASNAYLDEAYSDRHAEVKPGQYVLISVTDTGSGMPREVLERAFDPFFTTKTDTGTGLGLSQVYGFVKQSGGHIKIYSEPGEGTAVHMYLPRSYAAAPAEEETAAEPTRAEGDETILVVEDDAEVRAFICDTLAELNYRVLRAEDADSALRVLEQAPDVDLLLTDVVLPGRNGRQLSADVEKLRPGIRVLFMTGYSRNAIVHQGRLDPGVQLIQKPLTQVALAAKVRRVLDAKERISSSE
jgi:PAS domain S-box-containing protein